MSSHPALQTLVPIDDPAPDPRLDRLADVLVRHCAAVRPGDLVAVVAEPETMPAIEAVYKAVLLAGGHPSFHPRPERLREILLRHGTEDQITHISPFERHRLATCDVLMVLGYKPGPGLADRVDAGRLARSQASRRELMSLSMSREARGELRYVMTELPSAASARDAGMSIDEYRDWVFRAGRLDSADPVAAWTLLRAQQQQAVDWLSSRHELRFRTPAGSRAGRTHEGTDLRVDISGRTWLNCAGGQNFPDGEVFTGPRSADGIVNLTHPASYGGTEVDGIRLVIRDGRVVDASATSNEAFLLAMLDQDAGARVIGEIALGTNYWLTDFTRNTFYDEKIGGTFHFALGAGYPESGNTNQSGLHWDMVCDLRRGGTIHADGQLIQRDGKFLMSGWPECESPIAPAARPGR